MRRKESVFTVALAATIVGVIALISLAQSASKTQLSVSSTPNRTPLVFASGVAPDGLQLKMVLNATTMSSTGAITGNVTVVNTSDQNVTVSTRPSQNITAWDYYNDFCQSQYFIGYAVFRGHYSSGNISSAGTPFTLAPSLPTACPGGPVPSPVTFLPSASGQGRVAKVIDPARPTDMYRDLVNVTTSECKFTGSISWSCSFPGLVGYWNTSASPPAAFPFSPGEYTILAWDNWNQYLFVTFVVL